jgi:NADH:ubiquinone oxidoreductase subunit F (NADH-binding)
MTTILPTPAAWPRPLLGDPPAGAAPASASPAGEARRADPADLDAAVRAGAFAGLTRALRDLGATLTTATIAESGLRGRGGAGFPAAQKWRAVAATPEGLRYAVANGYEADPAGGTNRHLMTHRPYAIVEGLAIAALSVGAEEAILAVRAEYADAVATLELAVSAAQEAGYLGEDVLGSGRALRMTVRPVQGAYMLGEETVLLKALEGRRGQPEQRPPYPSERGLWGRPTLVHNVATLAAIPWIVVHGADAYRAIGDPDAPGTLLVQVSGAVVSPGIAEVPTGTALSEIVSLAGGVTGGRSLKALLVGGPSGGLLPADLASTPYTFAALRAAGAHVGSGSLVVADEAACVVDLARLLTRYCADEACGKTIPCRIGLRRMSEIGERVASGLARPTDVQLLADLGADIAGSALCDHERLATGPLATAMRYFRPEIDAHLSGICPAGVCAPAGAVAAGTAHGG